MAIEGCMSPNQTTGTMTSYWSNYLSYRSHADGNGQANLLRAYDPKVSPSTSTLSIGIGGSFGSDAVGANIGATWGVSKSDLELYDETNIGDQHAKIKFNYKLFLGGYTNYSHGTSWQNAAFIYQAPSGATYCKFDNGRTASFYNWYMNTDNIDIAYYTTFYKTR